MFGLFGGGKKKEDKTKKKEQNNEKAVEAIGNLNIKINDLEEKIAHLEAKKNGELAIVKEKLQKGDKIGAKRSLQKKKWIDDQIKTLDGAMMMLEEQKMMLDGTMSMGQVYDTLKEGSAAIKLAEENFNIEDLDKIRDQMEDQKAAFEEKNEFFKEYNNIDNEELDDELDQIQSELEKEALPDVKNKTKEIIIENKIEEKDDDVKNLEAFLDG